MIGIPTLLVKCIFWMLGIHHSASAAWGAEAKPSPHPLAMGRCSGGVDTGPAARLEGKEESKARRAMQVSTRGKENKKEKKGQELNRGKHAGTRLRVWWVRLQVCFSLLRVCCDLLFNTVAVLQDARFNVNEPARETSVHSTRNSE